MGLERLACIMQEVDNLFLVDTVQNIMKHVSKIAGVQYGDSEKTDISLRVITDHIRSTTFMIGDGVMPSMKVAVMYCAVYFVVLHVMDAYWEYRILSLPKWLKP